MQNILQYWTKIEYCIPYDVLRRQRQTYKPRGLRPLREMP